jgi:hypothetical protein
MGSKPTLNRIVQISNNEEAALRQLNANFDTLEGVITDAVSRSGLVPTQMQSALDMGTQRIINLGTPIDENDAVRYKDVRDALEELSHAAEYAQSAENAAIRANASAGEAANSATAAATSEGHVQDMYDALYNNPVLTTIYADLSQPDPADSVLISIYNDLPDIVNVSEHLNQLVWNLSTAANALTIFGTPTTEVGNINIGLSSSSTGYASVAIGPVASSDDYGVAYGGYATATGGHSVAIGSGYNSSTGPRATGGYSIAIGYGSLAAGDYSTALGISALASSDYGVSIGSSSSVTAANGVAVGRNAVAAGAYAIQLGYGTNSTANSLSVGLDNSHNYILLHNDGQVPEERLEEIMIKGDVDPLTSTVGTVGLLYKNTESGKLFVCISANDPLYVWKEVGTGSGGGSGAAEVYTNPSLTSSNNVCLWTITHNLNSRDIAVAIYDTANYSEPVVTIARPTTSTVTIAFVSPTGINAGAYKAVLLASSAYGTPLVTLNNLEDVVYTGTVTDGDVLVFDGNTGDWTNNSNVFFKNKNQTVTGNTTFSGTVKVPTPAASDDSTNAANTAWVLDVADTLVHLAGAEAITGNKTFSGTTAFSGAVSLGSSATATTPAYSANNTSVATTAMVHNLNDTQRSNCITEIPQDIHLSLSDPGTSSALITASSGTYYYKPNGVGTFDRYVLTGSISSPNGFADGLGAGKAFLYVSSSGNGLTMSRAEYTYSGTTQPTSTYQFPTWYDTANNVFKASSSSGSSYYTANYSLPLALISVDSNGYIVSIDQVFNGVGFVASTLFTLPGVKGLIPDGRNADGSLKSIEFTTGGVYLWPVDGDFINRTFWLKSNNIGGAEGTYNEDTNYNSYPDWCIAGYYSATSSKVTNVTLKKVFRAVDYSEASVVIESYNDTVNHYWYRVWSDGWIEQGGYVGANTTVNLLKPYSDGYYTIAFGSMGTGYTYAAQATQTNRTYFITGSWGFPAFWYTCGY